MIGLVLLAWSVLLGGLVRVPLPRKHPRTAHFMPYVLGDALKAIGRAARLRFKFIDQNAECTRDGFVFVVHWPWLYGKGWRYWWTGKRHKDGSEERTLVPRRLRQARVEHMLALEVGRFRSKKRGGRRIWQAIAHMRECVKHNVTWCLEAKGSAGFETPAPWVRLREDADETGCKIIVMTLQSLPGWRARLEQAHAQGFPVALLPRGPKPADWAAFEARTGCAVWGRWRG